MRCLNRDIPARVIPKMLGIVDCLGVIAAAAAKPEALRFSPRHSSRGFFVAGSDFSLTERGIER
jgi:hypothetical protein